MASIGVWLFTTSAGFAVDPSRTVVVVNEKSIDSLTIANHYVALRNIPRTSVIALPDVPTEMVCTIGEMKSQILKPLLEEIHRRGLQPQTDLVAYSDGFPTAIKLDSDFAKAPKAHQIFTPVGSLNGLTTLYQFLGNDQINYVAPRTNFYARADQSLLLENPFLGKASEEYESAVKAAEKKGIRDGNQHIRVACQSSSRTVASSISSRRVSSTVRQEGASVGVPRESIAGGRCVCVAA
jgi:hypothetical protein